MDADWDLAYDVTRGMGTMVGMLATGDEAEFRTMAADTMAAARTELAERFTAVRYEYSKGNLTCREAAEKIRFLADKAAERLLSINRFSPDTVRREELGFLSEIADRALSGIPQFSGKPELHGAMAQAAGMVVSRLEPGILMSMAKVPFARRKFCSIEPVLYILLDGKRSLYDAMKLYEYEMDVSFTEQDYQNRIEQLEYLAKYGYVRIRKA